MFDSLSQVKLQLDFHAALPLFAYEPFYEPIELMLHVM